jgi:hypothetical protein
VGKGKRVGRNRGERRGERREKERWRFVKENRELGN